MQTITNSYKRTHKCNVPLRRVTWAGLTRPVHAGIYDQVISAIKEWEALGGQDFYEIRQWWGYAPRNCTGASWHEVGLALDINPAENPYVSKRTPCPSDMPQRFIQIWTSRGFGSGLYWNSVCDGMHKSKGPNEGGDGKLYVPEPIREEDMPLSNEDLEKIKDIVSQEVGRQLDDLFRGSGDIVHRLRLIRDYVKTNKAYNEGIATILQEIADSTDGGATTDDEG